MNYGAMETLMLGSSPKNIILTFMLLYMHILLQNTKEDIMKDVGVQTKYERHEGGKMMTEVSFLGELSHQ